MSIPYTLSFFTFFCLISNSIFANTPGNFGGENIKLNQCIQNNSKDCIKAVCIMSFDLNCNANCQTAAENKCKNLMNPQKQTQE